MKPFNVDKDNFDSYAKLKNHIQDSNHEDVCCLNFYLPNDCEPYCFDCKLQKQILKMKEKIFEHI